MIVGMEFPERTSPGSLQWNIFYRAVNPDIYNVLDAAQKLTGQLTLNSPKDGVSCSCPHCSVNMSGT